MLRLRKQVDQIDLKLLNLLQQRTKLSAQIGVAKRRHGGDIYVPGRERELLVRMQGLARGKLPPPAITAIFREILSGSRAAQGQPPIGVLRASAGSVIPSARWCFGACDQFAMKGSWKDLSADLTSGHLALALLTGANLAGVLATPSNRGTFPARFSVVGDFPTGHQKELSAGQRIFVVTPLNKYYLEEARHVLILIECKSIANGVKSLLHAMPHRPLQTEQFDLPEQARPRGVLLRLTLSHPLNTIQVSRELLAGLAGTKLNASVLGIYSGTDLYGG